MKTKYLLNFLIIFLPLNLSAQDCNDTVYYGEGTYYGGIAGSSGGNCSLPVEAGDYLHCALNNVEYAGSNACGSCILVTGPNDSIKLKVVDRCPECASGDVDMTQEAFAQIADLIDGRINISWRFVPCELDALENIKIMFKSGSSIWWTGIQFRNLEHSLLSMEYQLSDGSWKSVPRELYNYFVESSGIPTPMNLRITSVLGEQLVFNNVPLVNAVEYDTGLQFSTPNYCLEDEEETCSETSQRTELVGKTVRIYNPSSELWSQIAGTANYSHVRLNHQNYTGTWTQWIIEEVIENETYYYRFKNVVTGKRLRALSDNTIEIAPPNFNGAWTQWEIVPKNTNEYYIKNRAFDTYLSADTNTIYSNLKHVASDSESSISWSFKDVNAMESIISCNAPITETDTLSKDCKESSYMIYTNVAHNTMTVLFDENKGTANRIIIFSNLEGKIIKQKEVSSQDSEIMFDISDQSKGIYIIRVVENKDTLYTQKIIVP